MLALCPHPRLDAGFVGWRSTESLGPGGSSLRPFCPAGAGAQRPGGLCRLRVRSAGHAVLPSHRGEPAAGAVEAGGQTPTMAPPLCLARSPSGVGGEESSVSHPGPRETRLAALECRATSDTGLPQHTSIPHRDPPRHISTVTRSQTHSHTLTLNHTPRHGCTPSDIHTHYAHPCAQAHSHGDGCSVLRTGTSSHLTFAEKKGSHVIQFCFSPWIPPPPTSFPLWK